MKSTGKRAAGDAAWRLEVAGSVAALVSLTAIVLAVTVARPTSARTTASPVVAARAQSAHLDEQPETAAGAAPGPAATAKAPASSPAGSGTSSSSPGSPAQVSLVLTAADHRDCPARATACVDLARHITWMQSKGKVTFGPVQMEPGKPAGKHQTPRGTFHVSWKAGPGYVSNIYDEAMPWATFFAAGGIAFHGGSLTSASHGCVHLTVANAHYYNQHLPVGAEVVVF
jgi:lipoprotein-anchoring transpeptidase ErfK/SrfK